MVTFCEVYIPVIINTSYTSSWLIVSMLYATWHIRVVYVIANITSHFYNCLLLMEVKLPLSQVHNINTRICELSILVTSICDVLLQGLV